MTNFALILGADPAIARQEMTAVMNLEIRLAQVGCGVSKVEWALNGADRVLRGLILYALSIPYPDYYRPLTCYKTQLSTSVIIISFLYQSRRALYFFILPILISGI